MSVPAQEGQVVDDGDVYEVACLLDDSGNGFEVIATLFGDENVWGGLSSEEGKQQRKSASLSLAFLSSYQQTELL